MVVPCTTPNWRTVEVQDGTFQHSGGLCQGMRIGTSQDGVMAEYYIVNDVEMNTAKIPEGVSLESALMVSDMMTTGFHGVELAEVVVRLALWQLLRQSFEVPEELLR